MFIPQTEYNETIPQTIREDFLEVTEQNPQYYLRALATYLSTDKLAEFLNDHAFERI